MCAWWTVWMNFVQCWCSRNVPHDLLKARTTTHLHHDNDNEKKNQRPQAKHHHHHESHLDLTPISTPPPPPLTQSTLHPITLFYSTTTMKVKALTRTERSVSRECKGDVRKHHRNLQPQYHPMQRAREYTRAVTSSKMDRMFAKPFVGDLGQRNGHSDAVLCAAICRKALSLFVSGSADGREVVGFD